MFWKVMKHWQTTIFCIGWLSDMLHLRKAVCPFSVCILSIFEYVPKKVFSCRRPTTKDVLFVVGKLHLQQRTLLVFSSFGIIMYFQLSVAHRKMALLINDMVKLYFLSPRFYFLKWKETEFVNLCKIIVYLEAAVLYQVVT